MNNCEYKRLKPFKWFVLQNFPFIDEDFDAITNYELLCKVIEYLNNTIAKTNELGIKVEELNNWFENLDVQEEINNKLDQMAEDGELEEIIASYINLNSVIVVPTVDDLIANSNLVAGSYVKTRGFYSVNDGGSAEYLIAEDNELNTDGSFVILLDSGLKAVLQYTDEVNILQLGAKRQSNNTKNDIHDYIDLYIDKNEESTYKFKLYIPHGIYYTTPLLIKSTNYYIYGDSTTSGGALYKPTIISAYTNQEYIIKCGDFTSGSGYGTIENLIFSTALYNDDYSIEQYYTVSDACLIYNWVYFMKSNFLGFRNVKGCGFKISTSWEIWINYLDFTAVKSLGDACFVFDELSNLVANGNISDSNFEYIRFEQIVGDCIRMNDDCHVLNVHFGTINLEPSRITSMEEITYNTYNSGLTYEKIDSLFNINGQCVFIVDNLELNNFLFRYYTISNKNYAFGDIIHLSNENLLYSIIINTINIWYAGGQPNLIKSLNNAYDNYKSKLTVNNIINNTVFDLKCDVNNMARLQLKSPTCGTQQDNYYITHYGSRIPCYKNAYNVSNQSIGLINYDADSVNGEKLVIKNSNTLTGVGKRLFAFCYNSNKLIIRAKIPDGETINIACYIYVSDENTYNILGSDTLTGTGVYKEYEITFTNNPTRLHGSTGYFQIVNNNEQTDISVDMFAN